MDRLIFEGRFLVNLVGSVMRQDALRPIRSHLDWEKMFRTADYHKVANIIYLGMLGNTERVPDRWKEHFFERYQEALFYGDVCTNAEKEVLTLLDMKEISCTILTSCGIRNFYHVAEMAGNSPLRLYLNQEGYLDAKGQLVDLGYETSQSFGEYGERMSRVAGFHVEIYHKLPFRTKYYEKFMTRLLERSFIREPYHYIRTMSAEDRFVFRLAQASYLYVVDDLRMRELLDLYLYYKTWGEKMNWDYIGKKMVELGVDGLAKKLLRISCMWFGTREDTASMEQPEDMGVFDILENRILSRGTISKETDEQALKLAKLIKQEEEGEKKKAKRDAFFKKIKKNFDAFKRKLRWIFPEYQYMSAIYPILEKIPLLLPLCWLMRGLRLCLGLISSPWKKP